ncbi:MAG: SUMF1/EgtB/PvdO family nonheme iron enzyme, partial [Polyangiaceae bacterium]|nr:SUMF1/EgtB/PvdO family nonheme iron enzyme [Polyangiaceae bacterium]
TKDVPAPAVPGGPRPELAHASTVQQEAPVETPARALPAPPPDTAPRAGPLPAPVATRARESVADEAPRARKPSRSRRRTLAIALGAGVALAAAVAAGVALVGGGARSAPPPEPSTPTTAVVPPGSACPEGMVVVAGARFEMGSELGDETPTDETPRHAEDVAAFCLDVREVSVAAYAACRGCGPAPTTVDWEGLTPRGRSFWSRFCNGTRPDRQDHPINCVDWHQAKAYCASRGARLPTEAEWELAARGGDGRLYPWGDAPPSRTRLNACGAECGELLSKLLRDLGKDSWPAMYAEDDGAGTTAPGGSFPEGASPAGVLDMAGNVWEWTDSAYCPYTRGDCGESRRVLRGGGWDMSDASGVRVTRRYPAPPTGRGYNNGFRCAADVAH